MSDPTRSCVACRTRRPQRALVRLRRRSDGVVVVAVNRRLKGRSAYVCPRRGCLDRAVQRRAIERALARGGAGRVRCPSTDELWPRITEALDQEILNLQRTGTSTRSPRHHALIELRGALREPGRSA